MDSYTCCLCTFHSVLCFSKINENGLEWFKDRYIVGVLCPLRLCVHMYLHMSVHVCEHVKQMCTCACESVCLCLLMCACGDVYVNVCFCVFVCMSMIMCV